MTNGSGRAANFNDGSEHVREPQFFTQQRVTGGYRPTSVMDNVLPNPNGASQRDNQRRIIGFNESVLGQSEATFDKALWLREKKNPVAINNRNSG